MVRGTGTASLWKSWRQVRGVWRSTSVPSRLRARRGQPHLHMLKGSAVTTGRPPLLPQHPTGQLTEVPGATVSPGKGPGAARSRRQPPTTPSGQSPALHHRPTLWAMPRPQELQRPCGEAGTHSERPGRTGRALGLSHTEPGRSTALPAALCPPACTATQLPPPWCFGRSWLGRPFPPPRGNCKGISSCKCHLLFTCSRRAESSTPIQPSTPVPPAQEGAAELPLHTCCCTLALSTHKTLL